MFLFLIQSFSSFFENFFDLKTYIMHKTRLNLSEGDFFITNSYFSLFSTFQGNGGTIYFFGINLRIVIEMSTFYECKVGNFQGGAIWINITNGGGCILSKVCTNQCSTSSNEIYFGQFSKIYVSKNMKNQIFDTSITKCSPYSGNGRSSFELCDGELLIKFLNSTQNYVYRDSSFLIRNYDSLSSCLVTFCSIISNNPSNSITIYFFGSGGQKFMNNSNVINNKNPDPTWSGIFTNYDSFTTISNCIISQNTGLLSTSFGKWLIFLNNYINHGGSTSSGSLSFTQNYLTITSLYNFDLFNSCQSHITLQISTKIFNFFN